MRIADCRDERAFPDIGFLGEEYGERPGKRNARWIIDPIDGTKNFIRGIPFLFATLIALEENGEITAGVMSAPAINDLLYAPERAGSLCQRQASRSPKSAAARRHAHLMAASKI
jgi:histidinol-phosphatase